ncbi:MAG: deoxycytidylate deaminase [Deltaproteobacteria bacterium]|nr:deoxycytidylate deaminase [Deltaproteobacteria bacterium]
MAKQATKKKLSTQTGKSVQSGKSMIEVIKRRQTEELVLAFCGPLGAGTTAVADEIIGILKEFKYSVNKIKLSELIARHIKKVLPELKEDQLQGDVNWEMPIDEMDPAVRIAVLQSAGNLLRKKVSNDVLAQLSIKEIAFQREESQQDSGDAPKIEPRRFATVLDSLKHPDEVNLLRTVYGNMFYLFGVLCPEHLRKQRLTDKKKIESANAVQLMERDKSEDEKHGQQLLNTIFHADFFVRNTKDNINSFRPNLERFVKLILGEAPITPTKEESAMYYAQSASARSACLSRQVGASIVSASGELISTGCNDVPKSGGGLYTQEDGDEDNRCMNLYGKTCMNDEYKDSIFEDIDSILRDEIGNSKKLDAISKRIRTHDRLQNLSEYCRAIHAEMDAITGAARKGEVPLRGASMFCTTFPCHNCARHIIASGIQAVYYIEPYEKSLALKLHKDAIEFDPDLIESSDYQSKVIFIPFAGVSPRRYLTLFQAKERKKEGKKIDLDLKEAKPTIVQLLDTYREYESKVVKNLEEIGFREEDS